MRASAKAQRLPESLLLVGRLCEELSQLRTFRHVQIVATLQDRTPENSHGP